MKNSNEEKFWNKKAREVFAALGEMGFRKKDLLSPSRKRELVSARMAFVMVLNELAPACPICVLMAYINRDDAEYHHYLGKDKEFLIAENDSERAKRYREIYAELRSRCLPEESHKPEAPNVGALAMRRKHGPLPAELRCRMVVMVLNVSVAVGIPVKTLFSNTRQRVVVYGRTLVSGVMSDIFARVFGSRLAEFLGIKRCNLETLQARHHKFVSVAHARTKREDIRKYRVLAEELKAFA